MTAEPRPDDDTELIEEIVAQCLESESPDTEIADFARIHPHLEERARKVLDRVQRDQLLTELAPAGTREARRDAIPERLGEFRLLREIGAGGMGVVYLAEQEGLGRRIALKLVRHEQLYFPGSRARFRREVEAVASLQHPGIVQVFTVGEQDGVPFFSMEFVEGASLAQILRAVRERSPSELTGADLAAILGVRTDRVHHDTSTRQRELFEASWVDVCVEIVAQVAAALDHAHERGVLHRDVKPSNVLLTPEGRARLVDFGLARTENSQELTRTTTQLGSLPYLAPEAIAGEAPIPAPTLDVYSLGVTLYEMLALRNPYLGATVEDTRQNILAARPPSLRERNRAVSWDLETVCLVAMERNPAQRYALMSQFARDLENVRARRPIQARRPGLLIRIRRWAQRHPAVTAAAAVALVVAALGALAFGLQQQGARQRADELVASSQRETYASNVLAASMHLTRDPSPREARALLESCPPGLRGWEWHHLALRVDQSLPLLRSQELPASLCWDDAGSEIFVTYPPGFLRVFDAGSGRQSRSFKLQFSTGAHIEVRPGTYELAVPQQDGTVRIHDGRSGAQVREIPPPREDAAAARRVAFSADGSVMYAGDYEGHVAVFGADESAPPRHLFKPHEYGVTAMAASDDGRFLVTAGGTQWSGLRGVVRVWDTATWQSVSEHEGASWSSLAITSDSRWLFAAGADRLWTHRLGSDTWTPLTTAVVTRVALRDDDAQLVTVERRRALNVYDLKLGDSVELVPDVTLTGSEDNVFGVCFQPGGERVATIGGDRVARVWDPGTARTLHHIEPLPNVVSALAFAPEPGRLLAGDWRGAVRVVELAAGSGGGADGGSGNEPQQRELQSPHKALVRTVHVAGQQFVTAAADGTVAVWEWGRDEPRLVLPPENTSMTCAVLDPGRNLLVTGGEDGRLTLWDATSGQATRSWQAHGDFVSNIQLSPDGELCVSCAEDGTMKTWHTDGFGLHREFAGQDGWIQKAIFLPGSQRIASGGADAELRIWDVETGRVVKQMSGQARAPFDLAVSPDGRRLFTLSLSGLWVWDVATGRSLAALPTYGFALAVGTDGQLVSASRQRGLLVWLQGELPDEPPVEVEGRFIDRITPQPSATFCGPRK